MGGWLKLWVSAFLITCITAFIMREWEPAALAASGLYNIIVYCRVFYGKEKFYHAFSRHQGLVGTIPILIIVAFVLIAIAFFSSIQLFLSFNLQTQLICVILGIGTISLLDYLGYKYSSHTNNVSDPFVDAVRGDFQRTLFYVDIPVLVSLTVVFAYISYSFNLGNVSEDSMKQFFEGVVAFQLLSANSAFAIILARRD